MSKWSEYSDMEKTILVIVAIITLISVIGAIHWEAKGKSDYKSQKALQDRLYIQDNYRSR